MSKQKIESIFNDEGMVFANISNSKRYSFFVFNENKLSKPYTEYNKQNLYDEVAQLMNNQKFDLDKLIPIEKLSPIMKETMELFFNIDDTSMIVYDVDNNEYPWEQINVSKKEYLNQIMSDIEKYNLLNHVTIVKDGDNIAFLALEGTLLSYFSNSIK